MDMDKYHIYDITGDGPLAKIAEYEAERQEVRNQQIAFAEQHGGTAIVTRGSSPVGILLPLGATPAAGWMPSKHQDIKTGVIAVPHNRTKAGTRIDATEAANV